jgi:hypothetical protein
MLRKAGFLILALTLKHQFKTTMLVIWWLREAVEVVAVLLEAAVLEGSELHQDFR